MSDRIRIPVVDIYVYLQPIWDVVPSGYRINTTIRLDVHLKHHVGECRGPIREAVRALEPTPIEMLSGDGNLIDFVKP